MFNNIRLDAPKVHTFTRTVTINQNIGTSGFMWQVGIFPSPNFSIWYTPQSVYIWGNSTNYSVASVPGYADLAGLFDEVQIERVDMMIYPVTLESAGVLSGSSTLVLCTDYNDKNAPPTYTDVLQYEDCKAVALLTRSPYSEVHIPKLLTYTLDSAGVAQPSTPVRQYVRSNLDTEHYCRKGSCLTLPPGIQNYTFVFKYKYNYKIVK